LVLHREREDRIAELIFILTRRDRDSVAAICRMIAAIAVIGAGMDEVNRFYCAAALRETGDDIEANPQPVFERG
jgi:hypothetical protein